MMRVNYRVHLPVAAVVLTGLLAGQCWAQAKKAAVRPSRESAVNVYAARSLLKKAEDLLILGEKERGSRMLETVIQQYADTPVRYEAYLALGKYYLTQREQLKAITVLRHLKELKKEGQKLAGKNLDMYLEGLYLTGTGYFQMKQYSSAFPILRKITGDWPNTVWANQAYYYVGMCHFAQGNWNKAIRSLSLVGTFVDPNSPTVSYVEAGRRFYVKIKDGDLPILHQLGKHAVVSIETAGGDREKVACVPLSLESGVFLASIPTAIGKAKPGDRVLQVVGGDKITTRYVDTNTKDGRKDVGRLQSVEVVSTASLIFTMGTYEGQAPAAFVGQPLWVLMTDADLDTSDAAEKVKVKVVSRYKVDQDESSPKVEGLTADLGFQAEQKYKVRDEVLVELTELGSSPAVHSGRFGGAVTTQTFVQDGPVVKADQLLSCAVGDEIVATCIDELNIGGHSQRLVRSSIMVAVEITSRLDTSVNFVSDPVLRARKNLVEATAFLELARIFASMGLKKGAVLKASDGLRRADSVLKTDSPIPSELKEEAFKIRWNLYLTTEDYRSAMATCRLFNRMYPDSPFVDQAMIGIADIRMRNKEYRLARDVYSQVLKLPNSMAKPEAQFRIAQAVEAEAADRAAARKGNPDAPDATLSEAAIQQYKLCAERFPESQYAGESLGKVVDYYIQGRDYSRADDLLEQIFQDYPDGNFLDSMLLKWVDVASRMGNNQKAYDKCSQLMFEYPSSPHAKKAKELLTAIKASLEKPPAGKAK